MNFDDLCNPGLSLGFNYSERPRKNLQVSSSEFENDLYFPSLTLGLSVEQSSKVELEVGRVVLEHDQDEDQSAVSKKLRLDRYQSRILQDSFNDHTTLNLKQKQALARRLNLRPRQVEVWYQNRRARNKLKQTEMDCEMLKKCYETLKDENRSLQKEVRRLKATKGKGMMPLFDMQLPLANLTICPLCERIPGSESRAILNA